MTATDSTSAWSGRFSAKSHPAHHPKPRRSHEMPVKQGFLRCLRFPPHPPLRAPRTENVAKARELLALHAPSCEPKPADPPPPHPRACPCCGAACASSKCSRAARRHDIWSRQPRSALAPHERAPHEHRRYAMSHCRASKPERSAAFSPLSTTIRGGAWPAPEPSTAGRASPLTLEPASIPHSVPVGTGPLHHDFVPGRFSDVEEPSAPKPRRRPRNLADVKPATWTAANLPLGVRVDWPATLPVAGLFSPIWRTSQCLNPADTKPVAPL
jgi:hypothetical protein